MPHEIIACWYCKRGDVSLYRLRNEKGKKTQDYVCKEDLHRGAPPIGNVSKILVLSPSEEQQLKIEAQQNESQEDLKKRILGA